MIWGVVPKTRPSDTRPGKLKSVSRELFGQAHVLDIRRRHQADHRIVKGPFLVILLPLFK